MSEVAVSTRVRLARNLSEYPFVIRMNDKQRKEVVEKVCSALMSASGAISDSFERIDMEKLSQVEAVSLVERHLISPEFVDAKSGKTVLISKDCSISIMINEEDHIRLQVIKQGIALEEAYDVADKLDTLLNEQLSFAFSDKLGYLTQCPTNLGTGMRASVMMHLPALQRSRAVSRIGANLSKLGLTIRGIYGESSEPSGAMYQLSNQVTLGISEKAAIENLKNITNQLISQEIKARTQIISSIEVQDTICRSLGILKTAKVINHSEAMQLLSNVRLGVSEKLLDTLTLDSIDNLITDVQPANVMKRYKSSLTASQRDIKRADLIREKLN